MCEGKKIGIYERPKHIIGWPVFTNCSLLLRVNRIITKTFFILLMDEYNIDLSKKLFLVYSNRHRTKIE